MLAFIAFRLLPSAAVMLAVSFLCFVLFDVVGDPVTDVVGQGATPAVMAFSLAGAAMPTFVIGILPIYFSVECASRAPAVPSRGRRLANRVVHFHLLHAAIDPRLRADCARLGTAGG
ncbi:MAG: hypothetical protein GEV13_32065 [Rhodospirillales bacterium]|nr:hypothetical protein [Rhodospirillales bacterium]